MMLGRLNEEKGIILPIVLILTLILMITGLVFVSLGVQENSLVRKEIAKRQAFYAAEAGLDRTLYNLKQDFENGSRDWTDGYINEILVGEADADGWRVLGYGDSSLGAGSYVVKLRYVDDGAGGSEKDEIWVKSTGTFKNINKTVKTYVKIKVDSLWNNGVSAGRGAGGEAISGNVSVHGSVHILGTGLGPTDVAIDMSGTAGIRNNYEGISLELAARIPPCPETTFNGETVQSLGATLRVKHGQVKLGGAATVGQDNTPGNLFKETMDGVYVTDGFTGSGGADQVHSDNGNDNPYDLGESITFPSLNDPYEEYNTYLDYLDANSLHISVSEISFEVLSFSSSDTNGSISWDPSEGKLEVNGIVYVTGGSLDLGKAHETIEYRGKGTIVVAEKDADGKITGGEIRVHGNLLAQGTYDGDEGEDGFPNNVLGLITYNLGLATGEGDADSMMTGVFYAENQITSAKQNELAGAFIADYFDLGTNVPSIYEVPALGNSLQTEMLNVGAPNWITTTSQWQES